MGDEYNLEPMNLIKNWKFHSDIHWQQVPPWVISGNKAIWPFFGSAAGTELEQLTYLGNGESYEASIVVQITGNARRVRIDAGGVSENNFLAVGTHFIRWTINAVNNNNFLIDVGQASGAPSSAIIQLPVVFGIPVGDPMYEFLFDDGFQVQDAIQTEQRDLGGGETEFRIASKSDASNCLIKLT